MNFLIYDMPAGFIVERVRHACRPIMNECIHELASLHLSEGVEVGEGYTTWYSMLRPYYYYALDLRSMLVC